MVLDGLARDEQPAGDLLVPEPLRDQRRDLAFTEREQAIGGGAAPASSSAERADQGRGLVRVPSRADRLEGVERGSSLGHDRVGVCVGGRERPGEEQPRPCRVDREAEIVELRERSLELLLRL